MISPHLLVIINSKKSNSQLEIGLKESFTPSAFGEKPVGAVRIHFAKQSSIDTAIVSFTVQELEVCLNETI